ncbi:MULTISPECIES: hypothetical protein [Methylosinus]|uniref:hypothetical protein n=1 Tax=Methylosinus TaxID=425 RepID=UPI00163D84B7|nr:MULTISPECIES: hypothetical protein [Methylosinus]MBU3891026.1 hypothetical protein [Methylosinus sp. KRF6]
MRATTLDDVLATAKPGPAHAAAIQRMGEAAFDQFAALAHGGASNARFQSRAVGVNGVARFFGLCRKFLFVTAMSV